MRIVFSVALILGAIFETFSANAQTLFTYGNHPVSKQEFLKIYEKNNNRQTPDYSDSSIREYLNLYALFRMKVQVAEDEHLDTTEAVRKELNHYKSQLAKTYLIDKAVTDKLVREAYERMKSNIRVAHILVAVRPADDSLKAKAKIDSLYNLLIQKKADFATLARQFSDDKTTSDKGGDLGYITALEVAYPFETVAYDTKEGNFSKPFRTIYGYHILKVEDRKPSEGQVQVAQIMIASPEYKGEQGKIDAKKKIAEIQAKLKQGVSFEDLVATYSDDKFTNKNDGILQPFGVGEMDPAYEKAAFALKKPGDISKVIETQYGFHILKLIKKIPLPPFDKIQDKLIQKVEADSRAKVAKEAYIAEIKKEYGFKEYADNLNKFLSAFAYDTSSTLDMKKYASFKAPLFQLGGKKYNQNDFLNYVNTITGGKLLGNKVNALKNLYSVYKKNTLQELQEDKLYAENSKFRNLVKEYKDGIMLFDLMDKKVWSKASKDTVGLKQYYQQHAADYQWQPGVEGTIYYSLNEKDLIEFKANLAKGMDVQKALDAADKGTRTVNITQESGRYPFTKFPVTASSLKEGTSSAIFHNKDSSYAFVFVTKINPQAESKSLKDAKGFVVADYQDFLEKQWNQNLKKRFPLKINQKELNKIIKN